MPMTRSENDTPDSLVMPAGGGAGRHAISPDRYSAEVTSEHRFPGPKAWGMIAKRLYAEFFYRGLPDKGATLSFYSIFTADRKSTRLNSSHVSISYAVFCLKKKKTK